MKAKETNESLAKIINEIGEGMTATTALAIQCTEHILQKLEVDGMGIKDVVTGDACHSLIREIVMSAAIINRDGVEDFCEQLITYPMREYMSAEDYDAVKEAVRKSLYDFVANYLTEEGLMMYRIACRTDI